jgi:ribonuclease BN (tRNA processing enzyme)
MPCNRRDVIASSAVALGAAAVGLASARQPAPAATPRDRLVLLGTKGGPGIRGYAPSPSANLLVHNGVGHLIDAGYGATLKLLDAGFAPAQLRHIFVTHHHSDHNLELGPLLYNAWATGLRTPIDVHGPAGLNALIAAYWESNQFDIDTRIADEGRPDLRSQVRTHEYTQGPVLESAGMRVTALRNLHPPIVESFALKFELGAKTIVFSGDTAYFPPLADFAKGADYLIHEVMYAPAMEAIVRRTANGATLLAHLKASHTLPDDVGRIAAAAQVKTLVLNHLVPETGFVFDGTTLTAQMWIDAVRATFAGEVVVGRDLLELAM